MQNIGRLKVETPNDTDVVMTRSFDAPRDLVYDAWTRPEIVKRWLLGPPGWSMPVCEIDARVGGKYRHVWRNDASGEQFGSSGSYLEVVRPERWVVTERMEGFEGEARVTTLLT